MSRGEQLARQWQFLKILENHRYGLTLDELSEKLECSRRTLERDIQALVEQGLPIQSEIRDRGKKYWKVTSRFTDSKDLILSPTEIISLYLANQLINPLAGTYLDDGWRRFLDKIKSMLPKAVFDNFSELQDTLYVKSAQNYQQVPRDFLESIRKGISQKKVLLVTYSRDEGKRCFTTEFHPYGLIVHENSFYLVGYSKEAKDIRTYKLQRLNEVKLTKKTFTQPDDFSLEKCIKGGFGVIYDTAQKRTTVRCEFRDWAARIVREQKWHATQTIEKDNGTTVLASFLLNSTEEFKRWVLGFGPYMKIIEPKSLITDIKKTADKILKNHI